MQTARFGTATRKGPAARLLVLFCLAAVAGAWAAPPARADTLDVVLKRDRLLCGVSQGILGFSAKDAAGRWRGFDVDFCRAVSAAVFGDADRVEFVPLSADERFEALKTGKIDLLSRNTTWTMGRDVGQRMEFVGVIYYDGQAFLTRAENGWNSAMELNSVNVCVQSGTTSEGNAAAFFALHGLKNEIVRFSTLGEVIAAYAARSCDALTADRSALAAVRLQLDQPDAHAILPEVISKEPLSPVVRKDDQVWSDVVRWVLFGLINAEEDRAAKSPATAAVPPLSERLAPNWHERVVGQVGSYADIFERNIGKDTPLGLERGVNALWTQGGLLYAPPLR